MVNTALGQIVGKRITGVVVKKGEAPAWQLHLVFDDDTCYEFWGDGYLGNAGGLDRGGLAEARHYLHKSHTIVFEAVLGAPEASPDDDA